MLARIVYGRLSDSGICYAVYMKLLFIYGPPAAGKLTVAEALAKRTGFKVFHNHLSIDMAREIFSDKATRAGVVEKIRNNIIEAAAKADINLIFTLVYEAKVDDEYVARLVNKVEDNGGEVLFVQLVPNAAELQKRVSAESRQKFSKIKDAELLQKILKDHDLYGSVPYENNLRIDNSAMTVEQTIEKIVRHYNLTATA